MSPFYLDFSDAVMDEQTLQLIKLKKVTRLSHLLVADVNSSKNQYRDLFRETLNIDYVELVVKVFEGKLFNVAKPLIDSTCAKLLINPKKDDDADAIVTVPEYDFRVGTRLFELYLALKQVQKLSSEFSLDDELVNYHLWFIKAVAKWLDIALFKAVRRILKAVALDDLKTTVDELVCHTASAVDIKTVFQQIQNFWSQLAWPDPETAYVFTSRILDDVCKATVFYADKMCIKVKTFSSTSQG